MTLIIQGSTLPEQDVLMAARERNPAFGRIIDHGLPAVVWRFAGKCMDYGESAEELGIKAQFVDINRKVGKLRRALWLGMPLVDEQPEEVLEDMIAHCLLTLDMLRRGAGEGKVTGEFTGEDMLVDGPTTTDELCDDPQCPGRETAHRKHEPVHE